MIYREFKDKKLSALGFGMMRLPMKDGAIDENMLDEMLELAFKGGVNYFDTAWGYHEGNSELMVGKHLAKYPRDSYYLASKFPGYDPENWGNVEEIFEKQLKKCGVEYFDFYLVHNVCEMNVDAYLDHERYGIIPYLIKQKEAGRIKHLGFSVHADNPTTKRYLDAVGEYMEFCQVQLNYLDWHFQDAKGKVEMLRERNIPVWVMEPVRGGKLVNLPESAAKKLKELRPDESVAAWAFRFQQSIPEVAVTLSGMSNLKQMSENIATFSEYKPLSKHEFDTVVGIADGMVSAGILPCTACRYCTEYCPQKLDIPMLLGLYNEHKFTGGGFIAPMRISGMPEGERPSACLGCRSCETVCPQKIKISEAMSVFSKSLEEQQ